MTSPSSPLATTIWSWSEALPAGPRRLEQPVVLLRLDGPDTLRFLHGQRSLDLVLADLEPLTEGEVQMRRIALGLPAAAGEINDETNPFELGLADRVSLGKGCYVGQETLARLATYDGVKQQLRRWFWPAATGRQDAHPESGGILRDDAGQRAGVVTSALALPGGEGWIGLALVRRAALDQECLWAETEPAGEEGVALPTDQHAQPMHLSRPDAFVDPPVGASGR
jgi:folate-binding protein YgfZ